MSRQRYRMPVRGSKSFRPNLVDNGGVEFNAFATVDFARTMPEFDKVKYKADRLCEERDNVLMTFEMVSRRLPKARHKVLKCLRMTEQVSGVASRRPPGRLLVCRCRLASKSLMRRREATHGTNALALLSDLPSTLRCLTVQRKVRCRDDA